MREIGFREHYTSEKSGECFGRRFKKTPIGRLKDLWFKYRIIRAVRSYAKGKRVLDIPSGNGRLTKTLQAMGPRLHVGADVSFAMLKWARTRGLKHVVQCDAMHLPFKDDAFDMSLSVRFLHHLDETQTAEAVKEIGRVAKVSVLFYDTRYVLRQFLRWFRNVLGTAEKRLRGVSLKQIESDIQGAGRQYLANWWVLFPISAQMAALAVPKDWPRPTLVSRILRVGLGWGLAICLLLYASAGGALLNAWCKGRAVALGNRDEVVAKIPKWEGGTFSFIVIGDVQERRATMRALLEKGREVQSSFAVLCGDVVDRAMEREYEYFVSEIGRARLPYPVFVAPGNHDCKNPKTQDDDPEIFRRSLGAVPFSFEYAKCLFVILDDHLAAVSEATVTWLDSLLSQRADAVDHVFVFLHVPLLRWDAYPGGLGPSQAAPLLELFDRHGVRYVFAGDFHGYHREVVKDTVHVVTGGGGGKLKPGQFHHLVEVIVQGDKVIDRTIAAPRAFGLFDEAERALVTEVAPLLSFRPWVILCLSLLALIWYGWTWKGLVRTPSA